MEPVLFLIATVEPLVVIWIVPVILVNRFALLLNVRAIDNSETVIPLIIMSTVGLKVPVTPKET